MKNPFKIIGSLIRRTISKIGLDKITHFLAGGWVFFMVESMFWVGVAAFLKELLDKKDYGVFDLEDFLYTLGGGFIAFIFTIII